MVIFLNFDDSKIQITIDKIYDKIIHTKNYLLKQNPLKKPVMVDRLQISVFLKWY